MYDGSDYWPNPVYPMVGREVRPNHRPETSGWMSCYPACQHAHHPFSGMGSIQNPVYPGRIKPVEAIHTASTIPTKIGPSVGPNTSRWRGSSPMANARKINARSVTNSITKALPTETLEMSI